jgi:hypothetical protein
VNSLVQKVLVQVVVDVLVTKATSGTSGAGVSPVVVMIGDVKMASVNIPQGITVTNQRTLPVVMEVVPRDSNPVRCANDV